MAQGFKSKPPANTHKAKSTTQKKLQPKDPKKGGKSPLVAVVCSPHPPLTLARAVQPARSRPRRPPQSHRASYTACVPSRTRETRPSSCNLAPCSQKNTSAHSSSIEKGIAAQALGHGKLTIMRGAAEDSKKAADK